ncbi:hypothetical protein EV426DRAFT_578933 [Tirmania nivea]|nr:hypothetical protein EV426DRAFT_578933 [Tirmania nivea]
MYTNSSRQMGEQSSAARQLHVPKAPWLVVVENGKASRGLKKALLRCGVAHHLKTTGPCYQLAANFNWAIEVPATPSEASTDVGGIDLVDDFEEAPSKEADIAENKENEKSSFFGDRPRFPLQPLHTEFTHPVSPLEQPPMISDPPPSGCPVTLHSPLQVVSQQLPAVEVIIPRKTLAKQRIRQRRKARIQRRRESQNAVLNKESKSVGTLGGVIIGPRCSHFHIGPVTMHVTE